MKTIKRLTAKATAIFGVTALLFAPVASAQLSSFDAEFAHFDDAPAYEYVVVEASDEAVNEIAAFQESIRELRAQAPIMSETDWKAYGQTLHNALEEDHEGLRHSALRLIVAYNEQLQLGNDTVVDLMRIYREDDSEQARRMAVVALGELDSELATRYLERAYTFEKSESVKRTIGAVVAANRVI